MTISDLSFRDHVEFLSTGLREKYDLVVEQIENDRDGDVVLKNDIVRIRLFPGWPRDPYVEASSISYSDPDILAPKKYFELWRYIDYSNAWHFFPTRWPEGKQVWRQTIIPTTVMLDRRFKYWNLLFSWPFMASRF